MLNKIVTYIDDLARNFPSDSLSDLYDYLIDRCPTEYRLVGDNSVSKKYVNVVSKYMKDKYAVENWNKLMKK